MALTPEYREYLTDLFAAIRPVSFKRAFGLDAIMAEGVMVGFLLDETIHLRTDEETRPLYEAEGGKPFSFMKGKELIVTSYLTMPDRLYDDPEELGQWARRALAAALQSPTARKKRAKQARAVGATKSSGAQGRKSSSSTRTKARKSGKAPSSKRRSPGSGRRA
jgi:DNA transformation protein